MPDDHPTAPSKPSKPDPKIPLFPMRRSAGLYFAAVLGHRKYCDFLPQHGAQMDIYSACALGKTTEAAALLKADPKLANARDERLRRTPLFWAARNGNVKLVELLRAKGAATNPRASSYSTGNNAITEPVIWGRESSEDKGETPHHLAASEGHAQVISSLVNPGADVSARHEQGRTPLYSGAKSHRAAIVKLLLEKKADPNRKDDWGNTPLHAAVERGQTELAAELIANGARVNARDQWGQTPLRMVRGEADPKREQLENLLRSKGGTE